jgi:hypothetical protein
MSEFRNCSNDTAYICRPGCMTMEVWLCSTTTITNPMERVARLGPTSAFPTLEVSDIQATALRPRPSPYKGEYVVLRIDDATQGREMLRRIIPYVAPAEEWWVPSIPAWLGIAFSYQGLKALGLPQPSLDSFPGEFRQGMAARASIQ